jgi:hypothetical protein
MWAGETASCSLLFLARCRDCMHSWGMVLLDIEANQDQ